MGKKQVRTCSVSFAAGWSPPNGPRAQVPGQRTWGNGTPGQGRGGGVEPAWQGPATEREGEGKFGARAV